MIPKDLAKKIRTIQIYTDKAVEEGLGGDYLSALQGQGMEFHEVREYEPTDDVRSIDWNVTARMDRPHIKKFLEERELTLVFLVDMSASSLFGSGPKSKKEISAEICALLAFSAIKNNDEVGLLVFTDEVEMFLPPQKGSTHVLRMIRELLSFQPRNTKTKIEAALHYVGNAMKKRCVLFLLSDFWDEGFEKTLRLTAARHDLICVFLSDARERTLPNVGLMTLEDAETQQLVTIDTSHPLVRAEYAQRVERRLEALRKAWTKMGVDFIEIATEKDYVKEIVQFFQRRKRHYSASQLDGIQ